MGTPWCPSSLFLYQGLADFVSFVLRPDVGVVEDDCPDCGNFLGKITRNPYVLSGIFIYTVLFL